MAGNKSDASLPQQYFDEVYADNSDPWSFATSPYEAEKYAASLAALPHTRYARVLEVGCSIGVFTHLLAERCEDLLAIDVAEKALAAARLRCSVQSHVRFRKCGVPADFPAGPFDLVTVCEVAYYLSPSDLQRTCRAVAQNQVQGADLLLVHWTPSVADYPQAGDTVHNIWLQQTWWQPLVSQRHALYRLDVLRRNAVACE